MFFIIIITTVEIANKALSSYKQSETEPNIKNCTNFKNNMKALYTAERFNFKWSLLQYVIIIFPLLVCLPSSQPTSIH